MTFSHFQVTLELLDFLGSNFVGVIYTDDIYGKASFDSFLEESKLTEVCVATNSSIPGSLADDTDVNQSLEKVVSAIREKQFKAIGSSFIVLYFGDARGAVLLVKFLEKSASDDLFKKDKLIQLIFSPSVAREPEFRNLLKDAISNVIITISPEVRAIGEYQDFHQRAISDNKNTWLRDYVPTQSGTFRHEYSVNAIVNSVFSLAETLRKIQKDLCGSSATLCEELKKEIANGLKYDSLVDYSSIFVPDTLHDQFFRFSSSGFVEPRFEVAHITSGKLSTVCI